MFDKLSGVSIGVGDYCAVTYGMRWRTKWGKPARWAQRRPASPAASPSLHSTASGCRPALPPEPAHKQESPSVTSRTCSHTGITISVTSRTCSHTQESPCVTSRTYPHTGVTQRYLPDLPTHRSHPALPRKTLPVYRVPVHTHHDQVCVLWADDGTPIDQVCEPTMARALTGSEPTISRTMTRSVSRRWHAPWPGIWADDYTHLDEVCVLRADDVQLQDELKGRL